MAASARDQRGGELWRAGGRGHDDRADDERRPAERLRDALATVHHELSGHDEQTEAKQGRQDGFCGRNGFGRLLRGCRMPARVPDDHDEPGEEAPKHDCGIHA